MLHPAALNSTREQVMRSEIKKKQIDMIVIGIAESGLEQRDYLGK